MAYLVQPVTPTKGHVTMENYLESPTTLQAFKRKADWPFEIPEGKRLKLETQQTVNLTTTTVAEYLTALPDKTVPRVSIMIEDDISEMHQVMKKLMVSAKLSMSHFSLTASAGRKPKNGQV